ncbi:MAG: glycoside hydrolase family 30 beta sandwich domain-containing protein [Lutibacter sp.]|nr:glycoside hydrolase family 30 beta sandwich domain-containing protein [Lutibacter sp.]MDP3944412.1 glycoside hydrolase family 30 beta sandwich domain-containing protein [Lutibacter sp.]
MKNKIFMMMKSLILMFALIALNNCGKQNNEDNNPLPEPPVITNEVDFWLTKADQSVKLQKQSGILAFKDSYNIYPNIEVDDSQTFQTVDGFGFSLTGGSAQVINSLNADKKQALLQELFGVNENAISINYLRISIGASDLDASVFSYNDLPAGQTDMNLTQFSLAPDMVNLIPLLKEILAINPSIKIMGSPWSPPVWMKDNNSSIGGSLQPKYYGVYAQYIVKYIQKMKAEGITIDAITIQNEPLHPGNNPSLLMLAPQQADFIKNHLGPAFQSANINTKIIIYDHNCDKPDYPINVLNDPAAKQYIAGSAFHLYAGDISALSTVKNAHPDKDLYFTEQYTPSNGDFSGDLKWHLKNVVIGSMRNWSKTALEWNLANNASFGPHTPGGCTTCKGGITINSSTSYIQNVGYYIVGHASKFVPTGSVRIGSNITGNLHNVAFKTPAGKKVLIVLNDGNTATLFNIKYHGKWITTSLDGGSAGTYVW